MILQYLNNPTVLVIAAIVMVMALILHNMVQAYVAHRLGDNTPRFSGFMAFDPQRHLEPIGVVFLFLLGFGWPRQVPVNRNNYRGRGGGRREAWVWLSGIVAYLAVGFVAVAVAVVFNRLGQAQLASAFMVSASYAVLHAVINLFPVLPLDMAHAALAWGNPSLRRMIQQIQSFGVLGFMVFFLALSFLGVISGLSNLFIRFFLTIILRVGGG